MKPDNNQFSAGGQFASTHWSVVLAAARTASPEAQAALEKLCVAYWYPLYAYLRRCGHAQHEAEDLTQEFFASRFVTKQIFEGVQPEAGRFRSWLLTSLQNLVKNEWAKQSALKRGGAHFHVPLDFGSGERRFLREPADELTPEKVYERSWALTLLDVAMDELREKYQRDGKIDVFNELKMFLPGAQSALSHAEVAARLGKTADAIKMAISRLRQEYGQLLKAQIKRCVNSAAEVDEELHALLAALGA